MKYFIVLCGIVGLSSALKQTPVSQCDTGVLPTGVVVSNNGKECTSSPCVINPANPIDLSMNFTAPSSMNQPIQNVWVDLIDSDYPFIEHDVCKGLTNTLCPIQANEKVEYTFHLQLTELIPEATVGLKFYILPEQSATDAAVCFFIKVQTKH